MASLSSVMDSDSDSSSSSSSYETNISCLEVKKYHDIVVGCVPVLRDPALILKIKTNPASIIVDAGKGNIGCPVHRLSWENLCLGENKAISPGKDECDHDKGNHHAPLILLVTARSKPEKLIIPKGGLHHGEAPCCGAMRETWEEAGVTGACGPPINLSASPKRKKKHIKYHWFELIIKKILERWPEDSQRRRLWLDTTNLDDDALNNLALKPFTRHLIKAWLEGNKKSLTDSLAVNF